MILLFNIITFRFQKFIVKKLEILLMKLLVFTLDFTFIFKH